MFGNLGEIASLMKNFQNIQAKVKEAKEKLSKLELTGKSSCGQVEVTLSGDLNVKKISISPAITAMNQPALLQTAVHEATANALMQVKQQFAQEISEATGGLNLPGMF